MLQFLWRLGLNRGLLGGSRFFGTLGLVVGFIKLLQKVAGTAPKTLYTHKMKDGQVVVITEGKSPTQ